MVLVLGVGRCAFRPPRVVFVLGLVSLINSLTSGKREAQMDVGDSAQGAHAPLQSPTKRAPLRGIVSDVIRWHDLLRLTLTSGRG